MKLKAKRVMAKIIDLVFFFMFSFLNVFIISLIFAIITINIPADETAIGAWIQSMPTTNMEEMIIYLEQNMKYVTILGIIGNVIILISGFLYFGIIGRLMNGSVGKYALKIFIERKDSQEKASVLKLFLREPLMHLVLITIIATLLGLVFSPFSMISTISYYVYLTLFFIGKDFWNDLFKLNVVEG